MLGVVVLSPGIRNLLLLVIVLTAVASNNSGLIASAIAIAVFIVMRSSALGPAHRCRNTATGPCERDHWFLGCLAGAERADAPRTGGLPYGCKAADSRSDRPHCLIIRSQE